MTQAQLAQGHAPLLAVRDVSVVFGGIIALNGVSFDMKQGQILGLIGPNGAGKTTLFNCLSRLYQPSKGDILMEGVSILTRPEHRIAEIGIGRTFQNVALFPNMTVLDNVRVGTHAHTTGDIISDSLKLPRATSVEATINKKVADILKYLDLTSVAHAPVAGLPVGTQKRVELARALAADPKILLLDEVMAGLNPTEIAAIVALIQRINEDGVSILLIEHNMRAVMTLSHRIAVLSFCEKIVEGPPATVANHPRVIEAYLGEEYVHPPAR
jgi:branched-chain amino acid transport system ATP-binding protein